eukprot:gene6154-7379_t
MGGGTGIKTNVHLENWAHYRETVELYFKWKKSLPKVLVWGVVVPVITYGVVVSDFVSA